MKKYILVAFILFLFILIISSIYAANINTNNPGSNTASYMKKCIDYHNNCLKYSYNYEYVCIHYNLYDCSWRKAKFIDKCLIFKKNACL